MEVNYGDYIGYEFVTLQSDNKAYADDSTENGITPHGASNTSPYTSQQGEWQCIGQDRVRIVTVSLNLRRKGTSDPTSYFLAKRTWTFSGNGNKVEGTYRYIDYLDGTFPLDSNAQPLPNSTYGPYPTKGRRFSFFYGKITTDSNSLFLSLSLFIFFHRILTNKHPSHNFYSLSTSLVNLNRA